MAVLPFSQAHTEPACKILLVDDDEEDYLITREMLKEAKGRKFELQWASNYNQGLEQALLGNFCAVLVDYDLGGRRTGIELIRAVCDVGCAFPLILYTGRGTFEADLEAMQAGATLYITKNEANPLLLERAIRYAMEIKNKEQALLNREAALRETTDALQRSEEKFAKSFRGSPVAIAISTVADGRFVEVNDSYLELFEFTCEEMIGHTSVELGMFPDPRERAKVRDAFRQSGGFRDYELRLLTRSGKVKDVLFSTDAIEIDGEECMLSIVVDITQRKQAEESLRASEEALRQLSEAVKQSPATVVITDLNGRIEYVNPKFTQLTGYTSEEALGQNPSILQSGQTSREVYRDMWKTILSGQTWRGEFANRKKNGEIYWESVSISPITNEFGTVTHFVAVKEDVTERKKAEEALREAHSRALWMAKFPDENPNPVGRISFDGIILYGNTAAQMKWGQKFEEGQPLQEPLLSYLQKATALKREVNADVLVGNRYYSISVMPFPEENYANLYGRDITERVNVEEKLAESKLQLERSNRELEQFAFVASHDLQEPLRKIRMFSDGLMKQKGGLPEGAMDFLERMNRAAERMQQMIDGLLELSRVSTTKRDFTQVSLKRLAEEALSDLEARVQATGGQVMIGELPYAQVDAVQIRQMFLNIIGNALKFQKNGTKPVIHVTGEVIEDGGRPVAAVRVADNGIGFEQQYAERIFQPFQRLHGKAEYEGTGLGLAIVNKIVERHGGTIKVESAPGEGATFTICLPVKAV